MPPIRRSWSAGQVSQSSRLLSGATVCLALPISDSPADASCYMPVTVARLELLIVLGGAAVCTENCVFIDYATESPNVSGDDRSVMLLPHPLWVIFLRSARSDARGTSAWPRKRTNDRQSRYVRFVPKADICSAASSPIRSPRRRAAAHAKLAAPHRADSNVGVGRDAGFH